MFEKTSRNDDTLNEEDRLNILIGDEDLSGYWRIRNGGPINSCFIATAVLGDYNDPTVIELRKFRDDWILKKAWGKRFVQGYYKWGKKVAEVIENRIVLKRFSYCLIIYPLLLVSRFLKKNE